MNEFTCVFDIVLAINKVMSYIEVIKYSHNQPVTKIDSSIVTRHHACFNKLP